MIGGRPRVLSCQQQIVIELVGRDGDIDTGQIENALGEGSVSVRSGRFDADREVVVTMRGSILLEEQINAVETTVRNQMTQQNLGWEVSEWRVEAV